MNDIFTSVLNKDNAMDRMCKSIGPDTTAEILEKGKRAEIGEVRTWGGYKYQKTASGWVPFKESSKQVKESSVKQDRETSGYKPLIVKKTTKDGTTEKRDYGTVREFKDKNGNPTYSIQFENGSTWGNFGSEEEAQKVIDNAKKTSEEKEAGGSGDKAAIERRIKEIESEQDQIEETTQENLLAIFKEELGPETDVKFAYPGERAEIYFGKGLWDSIIVKYSHLDRFSGNAGERKFGISVGVGSKTIEPGSSYAKIISFANKLLTDTSLSDKIKSELINYQEAGHKLFKEYKELALKLRSL